MEPLEVTQNTSLACIIDGRVTEEQASLVAKAQPEADPPLAEMGLFLEEACNLQRRARSEAGTRSNR